jgi:hypothetical protein
MLGPKGGLVSVDGREVILVALVAVCNNGFECTNGPGRLQMVFETWCGGHTGVFISLGLVFQLVLANVGLQLVVLESMALALDPWWELPQVEQTGCLQSLVS